MKDTKYYICGGEPSQDGGQTFDPQPVKKLTQNIEVDVEIMHQDNENPYMDVEVALTSDWFDVHTPNGTKSIRVVGVYDLTKDNWDLTPGLMAGVSPNNWDWIDLNYTEHQEKLVYQLADVAKAAIQLRLGFE